MQHVRILLQSLPPYDCPSRLKGDVEQLLVAFPTLSASTAPLGGQQVLCLRDQSGVSLLLPLAYPQRPPEVRGTAPSAAWAPESSLVAWASPVFAPGGTDAARLAEHPVHCGPLFPQPACDTQPVPNPTPTPQQSTPAAAEEGDECCICIAAKKEAVLVPCGHICLCMDCGSMLHVRGLPCPVCRARVTQVIRGFKV
eukprot:TRINITY_DN21087_c0_g1_i1.p1 TRINITY_DN21087_c0_g1~~TRINITY_DN21087_c0_g1_i1.p1  ORF type:complete len:197 (+),score=20.73 TRINITY_DN21087_c0_g1_i1:33-623(+)